MKTKIQFFCLCLLWFGGNAQPLKKQHINTAAKNKVMEAKKEQELDTAIFGAGCFWCVEAVFQRIEGVEKVISGYSGGQVKNPPYREVCNGTTGHAEVCMVMYDPKKVSFETLLSVFWQTHDPTTLNRQGNDAGTQYRSAIFYKTPEQKQLAEKYKEELSKSGAFKNPIVTEITAYTNFYPAEDYHQDYYNQNSSQSYCQYVIVPKIEKFEKVFGNKLRKK
ncbi:MAG: peptide-methionine (S)-S-oxide reductase MsrA [Bacteroidia bacterium]|nr:peptide-methionine (S)-S-oxide reductase MsrA [Bacteroidia bacterium]